MFVKICGLARAKDVEEVAAMRPDAMGFIFYPKSPRAVTPERVGEWTAGVSKEILRVGVFVNAPPEEVELAVETAGLDVVQLHGSEDPADYAGMMTDLWQVIHLGKEGAAQQAHPVVERVLIDQWTKEMPGGTGRVADWDAAACFVNDSEFPVMLAGGLTAENVGEAMRKVAPAGVDVSSGVEAEPGVKDLGKVKAFISAAREAI